MSFYTKSEFAALCGKATNWLSVYISRGKVVIGAGDLIDDTDSINKAFLQKNMVPAGEQPPTTPKAPNTPQQPDAPLDTDSAASVGTIVINGERFLDYAHADLVYKNRQGESQKKAAELNQLRIAKIKGQVIPSELIKPLILQHNQSLMMAFKQAAEEQIRLFAKKRDLTIEESAELKGQLVKVINTALDNATAASLQGIKAIISDFSEKRGVGERT